MTSLPEQPVENCEAVIIGFRTRRFLIVRRDEPSQLRPLECQAKRVRDLQPGDKVIYRGQIRVVQSLQVYQ